MKSKDSNVAAKDALGILLRNGFEIVIDMAGRQPKPTQRENTRLTRGTVMDEQALTSLSGKSVYLTGQHAKTGEPVTVFMQVKNRLSEPALKALVHKTGYTFN